ncbi:MFS transporter [Candidatus Finniella inopinata]|uniref:MFS transporter n=1 Tax=Candidatus Finniella inopinata TaxID=1696036 RepID=A0A4Q7DHT5_9PROT|nr:MFS transporter [Candidatus Finniella inopinata]RZI45719.1 MFS transporter [Candidatus Finniella inopinata]
MNQKKLLAACAIGNIIEWYEFMIFGYFAAIIGTLFFPSSSSLGSLFKAFGVFAIGVLVRPLGGILFGHIGDRFGRKTALLVSIYLMSVPTVAIGLLPSYESIGIFAPIALLCIRVLQGLSMGGEYAGTIVYLVENTKTSKKGLYGSLAAFSLVLGMAAGSLVFAVFHALLTKQQLLDWGWRIPFLLSIVGLAWGLYLRVKLEDSGVFTELKEAGNLARIPIKEAFSESSKPLFQTVLIQCLLGVGMYTMTIFYANYAREHFASLSSVSPILLNTPGVIAIGLAAIVAGKFSDIFGRKNVLLYSAICSFFVSYLTIPLITHGSVESFFMAHIMLSTLTGCFLGSIPSFLAESFPTKTRYTCVALSNNLSMGIFGGTAPMVITYLIDKFHDPVIPNYYLMVSALITVLSIYFSKDKRLSPDKELSYAREFKHN